MSKTIVVFFGPPGSGKGTQSEMLAETLGLPAISTGELLRREQKTGSVLGKHVKTLMASGKMLGVTLMDHILRHRLSKSDARRGFLLDGYPRKIEQLRHFLSILKATDRIYFVVIEVSDKEVLRRLSGRRVCDCGASYHLIYNKPRRKNICDLCGATLHVRSDDTPKIIKQRLKYYHALTTPMIEKASGRGSVIFINGEQSIVGIKKELEGKLKEFGVIKKNKKKRKK